VREFSEDGVLFKIYLEKNDPEDISTNIAQVALVDLISWNTDIIQCNADEVSLVIDGSNSTLSNDVDIALVNNPTYVDNTTNLVQPVLMIDRTQPIHKDIFLRGSINSDSVSDTVKVKVTVCGDEAVTNQDPQSSIFNINLAGTPF
jgi:hypothetical protein